MAPPRKGFKRESTISEGLLTPSESFSNSTTLCKRESIDLTSIPDDIDEDVPASQPCVLPLEDEGLSNSTIHQQRRSETVSIRSSRPPPDHRQTPAPSMAIGPLTGLEFVGQHVKALVDAINDLRQFGLDHVVQLPELVLVGDQSAGKSSLMSALTEVQLPRDQGICTKCPANITTSPAESWSCKVSLHQYYQYIHPGNRTIDSRSVTKKNPFPPWVEQTLVIKHFKTIYDPLELEQVIKWAQLALLNHNVDHREFIPRSGHRAQGDFQQERENAQAKFSPNVIAVNISGPGLSPLSFYDLPGIFRVAPDPKDQYLAKVIENLAVKYITRPNALIIWTLAMKTDPSNSSTGKVIMDWNASTRCLGVLTNPDHVQVRHVEYEKILKGQAHVMGHGYFVTRQPGEDSNLDGPDYHSRARAAETEFFDTEPLWTETWNEYRSRCGTNAIQSFLSLELARQISQSLPSISHKITSRVQEVESKLRDCPELPSSEVSITVQRHLSQFSVEIQRMMDGESETAHNNFQSTWTTLCEDFRKLIIHVKPMIKVSHESDKNILPGNIVEISDDENDDASSQASVVVTPGKRNSQWVTEQQARRQKMNDSAVPFSPTTPPNRNFQGVQKYETGMGPPTTPARRVAPPQERHNPFLKTPFADLVGLGKGFIDLAGIDEYIKQYGQAGRPSLVNYKTYDELCMLSVRVWNRPLNVFIDQTMEKMRTQIQVILRKNLKAYEKTALYKEAEAHLNEFLDDFESQQRKALDELYQLETHKLFTINKTTMDENKARELQDLKLRRWNIRTLAFAENQTRMGLKKKLGPDLTVEERNKEMKKRASEVKNDQLPGDEFEIALGVAAYVRGYYATAGMRFVDNVCMSINGKLFKNIRKNIFFYLERKLGITGAEGEEICRDLMDEDAAAATLRRELKTEKEKLYGFANRLAILKRQVQSRDIVGEGIEPEDSTMTDAGYE